MKFITNRISTSKAGQFSDFVKKLAESNASLSKTATSSSSVKKEANIANLGDKKAPPFGKEKEVGKEKEDGEKKVDEKETEECCATSEKEVKVAKDSKKPNKDGEVVVEMQEMDPVGGTNTGKPEGEKKKEAKSKASKIAANADVDPANKGVTHTPDKCCGAPTSKGDDGSEGAKSGKAESKAEPKTEEKKEEKKEASSRRMTRIANLDSKTKAEWKKYWGNLFPKEYVDAMFADK